MKIRIFDVYRKVICVMHGGVLDFSYTSQCFLCDTVSNHR